ncbi:MAG: hypothetical protein O8C64_10605 [Candidatus Methanoperedens sp.]|nr:hypothetical protein [Candidatus Methanoperedens sp.]MCZ7404869.1 hypothetical protein [Candidatus Methanoperedens sp.]
MNGLKELKDRLSKIKSLLDKLDERLVEGELSEAKYKELSEKYRIEADSLKNQIAEKELLQDVGLKAGEREEPMAEHPAELPGISYLSRVIQRLRNEGFECYENVTYGNYFFKSVAKKSKFAWILGNAEVYFVFGEFPDIDTYSLREFSTNCIEYAKKTRSSSSLTTILVCYPVAIVNSIDRAASEYIRNEAGHFHQAVSGGFLEMPAVYVLNSNTLYYFEKTPLYGWAAWGRLRETVKRLLAP